MMFHDVEVSETQVGSGLTLYRRRVKSWDAARSELEFFGPGWIFRGHRDESWKLTCKLHRKCGHDPAMCESLASSRFKRSAHLHLATNREPDLELEWLALIQHHGGPTRLLDFTRSPYVAAYFALEEETAGNEECAIWALNESQYYETAVTTLRRLEPEFPWARGYVPLQPVVEARLFASLNEPFVAPIEPFRVNARMRVQQGMFMCLGDPALDLFANYVRSVASTPAQVVQVVFPRSDRGRALAQLRTMNIARDTLFPGMDGLAQSLEHDMIASDGTREALLIALGQPSGWPGPSPLR